MEIFQDDKALWGLLCLFWMLTYMPVMLGETSELIAKGQIVNPTYEKDWLRRTMLQNGCFKIVWFLGLAILMISWCLEAPPQLIGAVLLMMIVGWGATRIRRLIRNRH